MIQKKIPKNYKEDWKPIEEYEGLYEVSSLGNIRSLSSNKIISQRQNQRGQSLIALSKKSIKKDFLVSRLVAKAFIPNPLNLPQVDHIIENRDKTNNTIFNLQWISQRENSNKYFKSINKSKKTGVKKVKDKYQCNLRINGKYVYVGTYNTEDEASRVYNILAKNPEKINDFRNIKPTKGVSFFKRRNKWVAYVDENKKRTHLGYFLTEEEALNARDKYLKSK